MADKCQYFCSKRVVGWISRPVISWVTKSNKPSSILEHPTSRIVGTAATIVPSQQMTGPRLLSSQLTASRVFPRSMCLPCFCTKRDHVFLSYWGFYERDSESVGLSGCLSNVAHYCNLLNAPTNQHSAKTCWNLHYPSYIKLRHEILASKWYSRTTMCPFGI